MGGFAGGAVAGLYSETACRYHSWDNANYDQNGRLQASSEVASVLLQSWPPLHTLKKSLP
jgi:hypothetical protein